MAGRDRKPRFVIGARVKGSTRGTSKQLDLDHQTAGGAAQHHARAMRIEQQRSGELEALEAGAILGPARAAVQAAEETPAAVAVDGGGNMRIGDPLDRAAKELLA